MHPNQERVAVIASLIVRSSERREPSSPLSIARASGFTLRTVERHWSEASALAKAQQRRTQDRVSDATPR